MIKNKTKKTTLAEKKKVLSNMFAQGIGLMFSRKKPDFGLVFYFKKNLDVSIHNFFVFYSIDLIFLDEKKKVIEIKKCFKPFGVYFPKSKFTYLIEVVSGRAKESKTKVGDTIEF